METTRRGRALWTALLLAACAGCVVLGLVVTPLLLAPAGLLAAGAYAAWEGLSLQRFADLVDDTTAPPFPPP